MKATFLGHASVLIEADGFKGIIDPYLKGNPAYKENPEDIKDITHIFITHAHGDHIGDALEIAKANEAMIITNAEIANILYWKDKSLKLHPMHIGGSFQFDFGKVKMTPALHGSGYREEGKIYDGGNPGGFLITINDKKLYHAGDTGLSLEMQLLKADTVDLAFLPIGGNYTMDIDDACRAVEFIQPSITVPMHYNTFGLIKADPQEFCDKLSEYRVEILNPGESINI